MSKENNKIGRRKFLQDSLRYGAVIGVCGTGAFLFNKNASGKKVWQLDAAKCIQCDRCASECVVTPSAVKCFHVYDMCGYCDLCGGYFRPEAKDLTTGAENMLCPTNAIKRVYIEEPFFEYHIDEDLCIGCGKCVKGCGAFGNGSLQLQVNHDLCVNCNECAIARVCPADAFDRVPAETPYMFRGFDGKPKTTKS
jgi:electron transport complex protein RnfB